MSPMCSPQSAKSTAAGPEARFLGPYELQSLLWSLDYCEDLIPEAAIAAAIEIARGDFDPDEGAA